MLGLDQRVEQIWPSQADIAPLAGVTRGRISQILAEAQARWLKDPAITALRDQVAMLLEANGGVMSAGEVCEALLVARGCVEDEPRRSRLARVVTRAAVETENLRDEPKYVLRRAGSNALIASDLSLADYAASLGQRADQIAKEDPLVPPARVVELLRDVPLPPEAEPWGDVRLVRLAAAASQTAAVSSKQEIYPQQMDAGRALKLSRGGLVSVPFLTPEQIRQRVGSRYPLAAALPGRPQLDKLLTDAGLELAWNPDHPGGGAYVSTARNVLSVSDVSSVLPRYSTGARTPQALTPGFSPTYVPPEVRDPKRRRGRQDRVGVPSELVAALRPSRHALADRPSSPAGPVARRVAVDPGQSEHRNAPAGRRRRPGHHQQPMGPRPRKLVPECASGGGARS